MSPIEQQRILDELEQHGYARFRVEQWDQQSKQSYVEVLQQAGFKQYQFYKISDQAHDYVIALDQAKAEMPYQIEMAYIKRNIFLYFLPLMIAMMIIAFTVILSQYSNLLMSVSIVFGAPIVLGAIFEYLSILMKPRSIFIKRFRIQPLVFVIIIIFAVIVLREGIICLIIISPIILGGLLVGAAMMRFICRYIWKPSPKIYSVAMFPLLLWLLLPDLGQTEYGQTQRAVVIHAPADQVYQAINHIGKIQPKEVKDSPIFWMGFPKPIFGMTAQQGDQLIRTIEWERGVKFQEVVQANHAPYLLSWTYLFTADSFPKGSVDDHIEMGGKYFDLLKTDYQLQKIDANTTKLILNIDYRLSTEYNWYSRLWVNYILGEFSDVVMQIHKQRLEQKTHG